VVQENTGEIRHFANSFRVYIKGLQPIVQRCVADAVSATGVLPGGEEYVVLGRADEALMLGLQQRDLTRPVIMASGVDLVVPAGGTFSKDIYAGAQFIGGDKNNYRAILGENSVHLGAASQVIRWVHAVGDFTAESGCRLYGRVSSDSLIRLSTDCIFLRLNAPRIEIGDAAVKEDATSSFVPASANSASSQRFFHDGDFEVQPGELIRGNIVIRGNLRIGPGARIYGSVKSTKDLVLGDGASVGGSLVGVQMRIGRNCVVHGPIIAERELAIAIGTRCGTLKHPTTISAPQISVEKGVVVFGTLWAREHGEVVASQ